MCAVFLLFLTGVASAAPEDFYSAIRNNDLAKLRELAKDAGAVNVPGRMGTTPLMYAATFGSVQSLQILLDAGADINAKNAIDATALIYGAWDPAHTSLLVEKGADVTARSKMGRTPLNVAAAFTSSGDTPPISSEQRCQCGWC